MKSSPGEAQNQWRGKNLELGRKGERIGVREDRQKRQFTNCVDYIRNIKNIMY